MKGVSRKPVKVRRAKGVRNTVFIAKSSASRGVTETAGNVHGQSLIAIVTVAMMEGEIWIIKMKYREIPPSKKNI